MHVLVAYGSKRGGTAGVAAMIGEELEGAGVRATVKPARDVRSIDGFDAVVLAGALYAFRWQRDARRFARRFADGLRARPVWLVSSGPLDDSATTKEIPPVKQVAAVMAAIGARGHITVGGRLESDAKGFPASAMAKKNAGDYRDVGQIHRWVASVVDELARISPQA
ncbi:MAG: flavodoxin domain-containing protein [Acidimicrobiales bacterium]|jgi:menaquinone-dependent protoporphyrinogen oxidase